MKSQALKSSSGAKMPLERVSALLFLAYAIEFADSTSDAGVVLAAISFVQTWPN